MLSLIFIYFIGKFYWDLAKEHEKSKWGFAVLGVASYYAGSFLFGVILFIAVELFEPGWVDTLSDTTAGLIALPFGFATTIGLYFILKRLWTRKAREVRDDTTLDGHL